MSFSKLILPCTRRKRLLIFLRPSPTLLLFSLSKSDGRGIVQSDFDKLNKSNVGLGLKNISSRLRLVHGNINFEKDISQTYYKVTIEMPKDEPYQ